MACATTPKLGPEAGLSALGVLIAGSIMAIVLTLTLASLVLGHDAVRDGTRRIEAEQNVSRALSRLTGELRQAGAVGSGSEVTIEEDGKRISFRVSQGVDDDGVIWSEPITYAWTPGGWLERAGPDDEEPSPIAWRIDDDFELELSFDGTKVFIDIASTLPARRGEVRYAVTEVVTLRN